MGSDHHHSGAECQEVFTKLSEYLDQELPEGDCERLREHLEGCAPCIEFLNSLKQSIHLCKELQLTGKPGPLPEPLKSRMLECYRKALASKRGKLES
jgi:RNA polymerase sigma-70 factor (ECF subfamily)